MSGKTWTYTYNAEGMRTKRVSGNASYTYYYNGDLLRYVDYDSNTTDSNQAAKLYFVLDANGNPIEVSYRPEGSTTTTFYYFVQNLQGDVVALVNSTYGNIVVTYTYDAWGNVLSVGGSMAETLGKLNPFRYRGYVYDSEIALYYCQSRYYDPELGRFINADAFASTGQGLLGNNMFAYCLNNPTLFSDSTGSAAVVCFSPFTNPEVSPTSDVGGGGGVSSTIATLACIATCAYMAESVSKARDLAEVVHAKKQSSQDIYSVYFLYEVGKSISSIVYVGRVKIANFSARMAYHATKNRALAGAIHGLSYASCRAIEQGGMIMLHTLNPGNPINNQIRGIGPTNKNRYDYLAAVYDLINSDLYPDFSILPASYWSNFVENEYLNMGL